MRTAGKITFITLIIYAQAWAMPLTARQCHKLLSRDHQSLSESKTAKKFSKTLESHGLDPSKLRIFFDPTETSDHWNIGVVYGNEELQGGVLSKQRVRRKSYAFFEEVSLERQQSLKNHLYYQGKGVGALFYTIVAIHAYKRYGLLLMKSERVTAEADRLWQRFVRRKLAQYNPKLELVHFDENFLKSKDADALYLKYAKSVLSEE